MPGPLFQKPQLIYKPNMSILFPSGLHADREGVSTSLKASAELTGLAFGHSPAVLLVAICPRTIFPGPTKREGHRCLTASLFVTASNKCQKQNILRSSHREMNASCRFRKMKLIVKTEGFRDGCMVKDPPAHARRWFGFDP